MANECTPKGEYCDGRMALPLMLATLVLGFVTVLVNLGVIIKTVKILRQGHDKPAFFFIGNLALSDFVVGLFVVTAFLLHVTNKSDLWRQNTCMLQIGVAVTACQETIFTIVLISVDKYLYICHGLHYSTIMTRRRVYGALIVSWCLSLLIGSLPAMGLHVTWAEACNRCAFAQVISTSFAIVFFVTSVAVPLGVVVGLYSVLLVLALRMQKARYGGSYTASEAARSTNFRLSFMSSSKKSRTSTRTTTSTFSTSTSSSSKSKRRKVRRREMTRHKEELARRDAERQGVKGRGCEGTMLISGPGSGVPNGSGVPDGVGEAKDAAFKFGKFGSDVVTDEKNGTAGEVDMQRDAGPGERLPISLRKAMGSGTDEARKGGNNATETEGDADPEEFPPISLTKTMNSGVTEARDGVTSDTKTEGALHFEEQPRTLREPRNSEANQPEKKTNKETKTEEDFPLEEHPPTLRNHPVTPHKTENSRVNWGRKDSNETQEDSNPEEPQGIPEELLDTDEEYEEEEEEEEEERKGWRSLFPSKYMNKVMTETIDKVMFLKKCRAVKTVLLILVSFTATYVPFVVGTLVYSAEQQKRPCLLHLLNTLLYCAVVANSLVNPLIYAYGYREFRLRSEKFKSIFTRKKKRSFT
ncbi:uncharacterized protein LOC135094825 isoform X2 [Scylla paramamosain]|uniref:uncharacterized protein LOC135094825 isoform X2 n=1 Tax=Scylla paramamosain TaxID=85552 RepID=UPI003083299D